MNGPFEDRTLPVDLALPCSGEPAIGCPRAPIHLPIFPGLLIDTEAAVYLRLNEGREMSAALKALNRIVDKKQIRPCIVGKHRRYAREELDRFIAERTERYGDV